MIVLNFVNTTEMIEQLKLLGFVRVTSAHLIPLKPAQTAEEQLDALDRTFEKFDAAASEATAAVEINPQTDVEPITADDLRAACLEASRRVQQSVVVATLKDTYSTSKIDDIPVDKLAEAHAKVTALGVQDAAQ